MLDSDCLFCKRLVEGEVHAEEATVFAIEDAYPVTHGHLLIIPKRHVAGFFELFDYERRDAERLMLRLYRELTLRDPHIVGYNIGLNCGRAAGQTVYHAHYHLIPRRNGDTAHPAGGVRGVIPGQRAYGASFGRAH
jgi:ATP adenylyltransferase